MVDKLITVKSIMYHTGLKRSTVHNYLSRLGIKGEHGAFPQSCTVIYPKGTMEKIERFRRRGRE